MKRIATFGALALVAGVVAWQAAPALQSAPDSEQPDKPEKPAGPPAPKALPPVKVVTPMAQRVATIGLLNKRNGLWRDLKMKPGEAVRIGDVVVRLRACEASAPWEQDRMTGAFVQVITRSSNNKWYKTFSGWLYKESPSLNVVEHPIYDVWTKACEMRFPDVGPDTTIVRGGAASEDDET
jgi:hypothetical protein